MYTYLLYVCISIEDYVMYISLYTYIPISLFNPHHVSLPSASFSSRTWVSHLSLPLGDGSSPATRVENEPPKKRLDAWICFSS